MRYIILLTSVLLLFACAGNKSNAVGYAEYYAEDSDGMGDMQLMSVSGGGARAYGNLAAPRASAMAMYDESAKYENVNYQERMANQERMVNYNGNIHLQNSEPEAVIDTVIERAKAKGGSVSNRRNGYASLQIPVAEFKNFFDYILTLGQVASKSISASDITEAYADNAARLRIAENTLARLQELLAAAKTEQEKIALLKEIQRVSEQIEQRKLEEKELLRMAKFSTITLRVSNMPAQALPARINIKAFEWLSMLTSADTYSNMEKALKLEVPKDFIETSDSKKRWAAASALNAKFWAYEKKNEPQGTPYFWSKAMLEFFKSNYAAELKSEDNFFLVRLQSFRPEPEIYYIAILKTSDNKTLKIAQTYFPNKEAEEKNSEAVLKTLRNAK